MSERPPRYEPSRSTCARVFDANTRDHQERAAAVAYTALAGMIESGKCRRQSLSDAAIGWSAPREAAPDGISPSSLVVDARGEDVIIGNAFRMADVVA